MDQRRTEEKGGAAVGWTPFHKDCKNPPCQTRQRGLGMRRPTMCWYPPWMMCARSAEGRRQLVFLFIYKIMLAEEYYSDRGSKCRCNNHGSQWSGFGLRVYGRTNPAISWSLGASVPSSCRQNPLDIPGIECKYPLDIKPDKAYTIMSQPTSLMCDLNDSNPSATSHVDSGSMSRV